MKRDSLESCAFIVFEGPEGCGKSTQVRFARDALDKGGVKTILAREPGGTTLGEKLRKIILKSDDRMDLRAEVLLYMASRAQMVDEIIRPALEEGKTVLCERYLSSTAAYQGVAGGVDLKTIECIGSFATGDVKPDLTIIIDIETETGLSRAGSADRMESRGKAYHEKVREGFLRMAENDPQKFVVIDGRGSVEKVHSRIMALIDKKMGIR